jgi:hypothetical protein
MPVITLKSTRSPGKTKKKKTCYIVNPQPQLHGIHLFVRYIREVGIVDIHFQAIDGLVCS